MIKRFLKKLRKLLVAIKDLVYKNSEDIYSKKVFLKLTSGFQIMNTFSLLTDTLTEKARAFVP